VFPRSAVDGETLPYDRRQAIRPADFYRAQRPTNSAAVSSAPVRSSARRRSDGMTFPDTRDAAARLS
jgi:hypothetical protein